MHALPLSAEIFLVGAACVVDGGDNVYAHND